MFKKFLKFKYVIGLTLLLAACGNSKTIDGITYGVFGLLNQEEKRNPNIEYEVSLGSIIVAILFSETVIIPIYVVCVDLYQPVGKKTGIKGQIS